MSTSRFDLIKWEGVERNAESTTIKTTIEYTVKNIIIS